MLRYAFRRLLWIVPSVLAATLLGFFVLARMPDPYASLTAERAGAGREQPLRQRHAKLPLFVNVHPQDARARTEQAVDTLATAAPDAPEAQAAARELVRIGGVGLPFALPALDSLSPDARARVAVALAPLAERLELVAAADLRDPAAAVLFWTRFWETRGVEFRAGTVRAAVRRFASHGQEARAEELRALDSFALDALFGELTLPTSRAEVERARRLVDVIAHVTALDDRIAPDAEVAQAQECVVRWLAWWEGNESEYQVLVGTDRVRAIFLETRFAKWALELARDMSDESGAGPDLAATLTARARVTLAVLLLGMGLAWALSVPLGALGAALRGSAADRALGWLVLVPHALSPVVLGAGAAALGGGPAAAQGASGWALAGAAGLLALALLAEPTRQQRAALVPILASEHLTAAAARGASRWRLVLVHGVRGALLPLAARAPVELATALTGTFVLEHALGLPGLGDATITAVVRGDLRWLMLLLVLAAGVSVVSLVLSDLACALLAPRARDLLLEARRRSA